MAARLSLDESESLSDTNELECIQMEDEIKKNSWDAKAMVRRLWKAVEFHERCYNKIKRDSTNRYCSMEL
jgi:hypothetical protein